ncbi:uncharacterized protein LOC117181514 [Belonocnema kinseyi]|uniref:uncharacterized protein LOC117181514 n=1 Tax=Belonocnema kinseyi TaxID=2817044 RepID=UPI00143D292E|nr:uncharacterized protein LOC117181514 [Belonocnema kinseyi]
MPACSSENVPRFWSSSPPTSRSSSLSPSLPSSPVSTSPPNISPVSTLKRSTSNISYSSDTSEHFSQYSNTSSNASTVIFSPRRRSRQMNQNFSQHQQEMQQRREAFLLSRIFFWYLGLLLTIIRGVLNVVGYAIWAPGLWASAWVCLFWIILQLPLTMLKWLITILHTPASERARNKRCVLISGGSTVQAVRLAQNFYKAGARVVIFDLEGLFALARFSIACSKYYTVPPPGPGRAAEYVKALKDIVQKERAVYYIPVSATSTAYYDALAKQYLEIMGCECFVPGAADVTALDDPLELLRRCSSLGLSTPNHYVLRSEEDVARLYEAGTLRKGRHMMLAAGPAGMRDRIKVILPPTEREFRHQELEISERKPWVAVRDPGGSHFITCTTIKDSRVVANVTCRVDEVKGLIPEERANVDQWLERFFARTFGSRINGHMSFRLAMSKDSGELVSIGCRVGIGLPYICHTSLHPRLVWRPCRHFSRQNSGHLLVGERHLMQEAVASAFKRSSSETSCRLLGTVLDKREALFVYWDPLPYCAYYYLQLPFRRVAGAIRAQHRQHNPPLAVVQ